MTGGRGFCQVFDVYIYEYAHSKGVLTIVSHHDFDATPARDTIVSHGLRMAASAADIVKFAYMPRSISDMLELLAATAELSAQLECPLIAVSMGKDGMLSRFAGEIFGSAVTFTGAGRQSAPGQIPIGRLRRLVEMVHESIAQNNEL
jgi:3-dehydroquinate dehydratase-1